MSHPATPRRPVRLRVLVPLVVLVVCLLGEAVEGLKFLCHFLTTL